jgi:PDZ domain-containing secreted protein
MTTTAPTDVVVKFDKNELYSEDDIADFLLVSKPGQKVVVKVQRAKTDKLATVRLELGSKKEGRLVLVGLSGAET